MRSMKGRGLSSGTMVVAATGLIFAVVTAAHGVDATSAGATSADAVRRIRGRTIFSEAFPKAELSVQAGFRFIGTQQVNLYGNAEAEQYLFARLGPDDTVERFYWVQFEHFLPTNTRTYNYASTRTTQIDDLQFIYNVKSWPDFAAAATEDPASDGAAIERLLTKRHLSFPHRAVQVRMFHLPSADHRTELMIIYGEALPQGTAVPVRNGGVDLDVESPGSAQMFLEHARQGLAVQTR
jgi:hypothetical protein